MQDHPSCPACRASDWEAFGRRVFDAADLPGLAPSRRLMLSVLFEKWRPGEDRVELRLEGCRRCGMMIYAPRPTEADIEAKYRFLNTTLDDATPSKNENAARTRQRANRLFSLVKRHLARPTGELRVLDFGGGDGRLMQRFVELGATCHLIDYSSRPVPGVAKIGDDQNALAPGEEYDLIICSHVVEHLASPMDVLSRLRSHLATDGAIYVEVPMEVYRDLPIKSDPVTHVNFFTPASLATLLTTSGLGVESSRLSYYPHPGGGWKLAVGAIATREARAAPAEAGVRELKALLTPSFLTKLRVRTIKFRDQRRFRA